MVKLKRMIGLVGITLLGSWGGYAMPVQAAAQPAKITVAVSYYVTGTDSDQLRPTTRLFKTVNQTVRVGEPVPGLPELAALKRADAQQAVAGGQTTVRVDYAGTQSAGVHIDYYQKGNPTPLSHSAVVTGNSHLTLGGHPAFKLPSGYQLSHPEDQNRVVLTALPKWRIEVQPVPTAGNLGSGGSSSSAPGQLGSATGTVNGPQPPAQPESNLSGKPHPTTGTEQPASRPQSSVTNTHRPTGPLGQHLEPSTQGRGPQLEQPTPVLPAVATVSRPATVAKKHPSDPALDHVPLTAMVPATTRPGHHAKSSVTHRRGRTGSQPKLRHRATRLAEGERLTAPRLPRTGSQSSAARWGGLLLLATTLTSTLVYRRFR